MSARLALGIQTLHQFLTRFQGANRDFDQYV